MNMIVPFKVPPLAPVYSANPEEMYCGEKKILLQEIQKKENDARSAREERKWLNTRSFLLKNTEPG